MALRYTLDELGQECHEIARAHGFYEDYERVRARLSDSPEDLKFFDQIWISHRLMLIVSELAEGLEAIRDGNLSGEPKSGGLAEELGDAQIRLVDLFYHCALGADRTVFKKIEFNRSRPFKHGRSL